MAYFSTDRDNKSYDHDLCEKAKNHVVRLSGAFCRVKGKLAYGRYPITDRQFCPIHLNRTVCSVCYQGRGMGRCTIACSLMIADSNRFERTTVPG
jgi:hypothetical protein